MDWKTCNTTIASYYILYKYWSSNRHGLNGFKLKNLIYSPLLHNPLHPMISLKYMIRHYATQGIWLSNSHFFFNLGCRPTLTILTAHSRCVHLSMEKCIRRIQIKYKNLPSVWTEELIRASAVYHVPPDHALLHWTEELWCWPCSTSGKLCESLNERGWEGMGWC